jgi:two-component system NtrC family sensor kinase
MEREPQVRRMRDDSHSTDARHTSRAHRYPLMSGSGPTDVESLIDVLPWPCALIGNTGVVTRINPAMEATGIRLSHGDRDLRSLFPAYWTALHGEPRWLTAQEVEITRDTPCGSSHEKIWLRPLGDRSLLIVSDETRRRELETAHAQHARLASLGFLLASVSHEINNPVTAIASIAQILQSRRGVSADVRKKGIAQIADNVQRLLLLTRKLTGFARVDDTTRTRFPVDSAIDEAFLQLKYDSLGETVALDHQRDERAIVLGYQGQLQQVFLNLFLNAAQAMKGHGTISVSTEIASPSTLVVTVGDSGPGIPDVHIEHIFKPFFTTKCGSGMGLGLAIGSEIIHEHGGAMLARNRSDSGALFEITLPLARNEGRSAP